MKMNGEKPDWLSTKADLESLREMKLLLSDLDLHTVCESAACPNIGKCFDKGTATFMILGDTCSRNCKFCAVKTGKPLTPDPEEPKRVADAVERLGLKHAVVTSVTRDDLDDFGANQFAETIEEIRRLNLDTTVEVLIPDFQGSLKAIKRVVDAKPDIINHNVETVPRLYKDVRSQAKYGRSLQVLRTIKSLDSEIYTKSGLMVGIGETEEEVLEVMKDLRSVRCDILTLGQYLRPSKEQLEVKEYVTPEKFQKYKKKGEEMGFIHVASDPLVRSSFNVGEALKGVLEIKRKIR